MKDNFTQQEVLLLKDTSFAAKQNSEKDSTGNSKNLTTNEKLENACWNGLIKEMLPEIFSFHNNEAKLYLWQVKEARHFFAMDMSEHPSGVDKNFSIDPYRFAEGVEYN